MNFWITVWRWWIYIFGLGMVSFPIAFKLFNRFWDRGFAFSKIIGIGLVSYWIWIGGSLRLLPFESLSIWIGIFLLFYSAYYIWSADQKALKSFLRSNWRLIVFEEVLFGISLVFWSWVRAHQPDINGLEKFMDFGFINSILRSRFFPPADIWLSGNTINYYYFGHLVAAVLTKLAGISSTLTYNLMIATLLALTLSGAFSLGATITAYLTPKLYKGGQHLFLLLAGLVSAIVLTFAGNLHTIVAILSEGVESYWYPDATRYIPYTIHEFPIYSFVVSDLHGHVSNIPFVLLILAFFLAFVLEYRGRWLSFPLSTSFYWRLIGIGILLGILYMTNALDAPIYLLLGGLIFFISIIGKYPLKRIAISSSTVLAIITISALIFSLPFHLSFSPFTKGVSLVNTRSALQQLLVLWGFFLLVGGSFLLLFLLQRFQQPSRNRLFNPLVSQFIFTFMAISFLLVVLPEFIYFKDIYIAEYHRANTMFKLVYQTFILMSLVTGPVFVSLLWWVVASKNSKLRLFLSIVFLILTIGLTSILIYPYFAVRSYYNRLYDFKGLDGIAWFLEKYPADYEAVSWLRREIASQPVIAEAVGESYTDFARVSANTGLPTVLGWRVHEWLWRGSFDEASKRTGEVEKLYTSRNLDDICSIIKRYSIEYVFVGDLERQQYPALNEEIFQQIGKVVFSQGNTRIYQIKAPCGGLNS